MNIQINLALDPSNEDHISFAKWYDKTSPDEILNSLICGYYIYKNIDKLIPNTNNHNTDFIAKLKQEHNDHIQLIYEQHLKDIEQYRKRLSSQSDEHVRKLNSQNDDYIKKLSEQHNDWLSKYDKLLREYNEYVKSELNNIKDQEIQNLKSQLTVIQNTNIYKGEQGEKTITDILQSNFIGYEIKDTSSQTNFADIHLIDRNGFMIAIESKNKATISTQDVTKSIKDITNLKTKFQDKFVGYIFVSLRSQNIPKKGDIYYEIIENIPIIWYGTQANSQLFEHDIINLIKLLYMHPRTSSSNENIYISYLNEHIKNINNVRKTIEVLKTNITSLKTTIDNMYEDLQNLVSKEQVVLSHSCPYCDAIYKRKGDLQRHITTKHNHQDSDKLDKSDH